MYRDSDFDEDYSFVQDIHGDVSRTFELALDNLSGDMKDVVRTSYLLCRIPDTIEDSGHIPVEQKSVLLDQYLDIVNQGSGYDIDGFVRDSYEALEYDAQTWSDLTDLDEDSSYWKLLENTDRVFNVFEQSDPEIRKRVESNVSEMVEGMRDISAEIAQTDVDGIRIDNLEDLADYNYIVAGTVGNLLTDVFTYKHDFEDEDRLYEISEDFGHFLQTVNIIKDPYDDYIEEDAVFVPDSLVDGSFHQEVIDELEFGEGNKSVLNEGILELVDHADEHSENVIEYIDIVQSESKEIGSYLQVPALLAKATLREAKENPMDAFQKDGISIGKAEALTLNQKATEWNNTEAAMEEVGKRPIVTLPNRFKAALYDLKKKL
jgi:farnesyl-diphosphate farnesyltransferase